MFGSAVDSVQMHVEQSRRLVGLILTQSILEVAKVPRAKSVGYEDELFRHFEIEQPTRAQVPDPTVLLTAGHVAQRLG